MPRLTQTNQDCMHWYETKREEKNQSKLSLFKALNRININFI